MTRIICTKCKNGFLQKLGSNYVCPSCNEEIPCTEENLLLGIQSYNDGEYSKANDYFMKYIVKNGAEPKAIIYKALCDGFDFDEDTVSLKSAYEKLLQSLKEIEKEAFPQYLAVVNDETEKLEKLIAQKHIHLFEDADAEKIKKEVTAIISIQNGAKEFRSDLTLLTEQFNQTEASIQISFAPAKCFLVDSQTATDVGALKYNKILENIEAHTVFTGSLSTDIKNLEIYYRCIVMFFESNRQKYDFLMASAEKFSELSKLLEEGRYSTIKGTSTIGDKLKAAAYDFFQESLRDHDIDPNAQEGSVVIIDIKPDVDDVEESCENEEILEDISSTSDEFELSKAVEEGTAKENTHTDEVSADSTIEIDAVGGDTVVIDAVNDDTSIANTENTEGSYDEAEENKPETNSENDAEEASIEETMIIDITSEGEETLIITDDAAEDSYAEEIEISEENEEASADNQEDSAQNEVEAAEDLSEEEDVASKFQKISDEGSEEAELKPKKKHKKSYGPIVAILLLVFGIAAIISFTVIPDKLNEGKYIEAKALAEEKNYAKAAEVFATLDDYKDSADLALQCKYDYAKSLEEQKEYDIAKGIYEDLGNFSDSKAKVESCVYNSALLKMDNGKYEEAIKIFEEIPEYADSKDRIEECKHKQALSLIEAEHYTDGIDILTSLKPSAEITKEINEAKYAFVKANSNKENATTIGYLNDLVKIKYKDAAALRDKLLGKNDEETDDKNNNKKAVTSCINYSETDSKKNLKKADNAKPIYFHVTVNDKKYLDKKLTIQFETSMGYVERHTITLTEDKNSYALFYPSTSSKNYTVQFSLKGNDNKTIATQKITIV